MLGWIARVIAVFLVIGGLFGWIPLSVFNQPGMIIGLVLLILVAIFL